MHFPITNLSFYNIGVNKNLKNKISTVSSRGQPIILIYMVVTIILIHFGWKFYSKQLTLVPFLPLVLVGFVWFLLVLLGFCLGFVGFCMFFHSFSSFICWFSPGFWFWVVLLCFCLWFLGFYVVFGYFGQVFGDFWQILVWLLVVLVPTTNLVQVIINK